MQQILKPIHYNNMEENKSTFIVYEGNQWLERGSLIFRGAFTNKQKAIEAILDNHAFQYSDFFEDEYNTGYDKQYYKLQNEIKRILEIDSQVSANGLGYMIEEVETNEWN